MYRVDQGTASSGCFKNRLARTVEYLGGEAQNFAIQTRSIHDLPIMQCIMERVGYKPGFSEALMKLYQLKEFEEFHHRYFAVSSKLVGFGPAYIGGDCSNAQRIARNHFRFADQSIMRAFSISFEEYEKFMGTKCHPKKSAGLQLGT